MSEAACEEISYQCVYITTKGKRCSCAAKVGNLCNRHYDKTHPNLDHSCTKINTKGKRCAFKAVKDGLCTLHYNKIEPSVDELCNKMTKRGKRCTNKAVKDGSCTLHYNKIESESKLEDVCEKITKKGTRCTFKAVKEGLCTLHYNKKDDEEIPEVIENIVDDGICIKMTKLGNRCTFKSVNENLCMFHYNIKYGKEILKHEGITKICYNLMHKSCGSKYLREEVPIENFLKPSKSEEDLYCFCIDCRNYGTKLREKQKNNYEILSQNVEPGFGFCFSEFHEMNNNSIFTRDKVPISMFNLESKNAKELSKNCSDCRKYAIEKGKKEHEVRRKKAEEEGNFFCRTCSSVVEIEDRAFNIDGSESTVCKNCKEKSYLYTKERMKHLRKTYRTIQMEFITKYQCSCKRCKSIFLKPDEGTHKAIELQTFKKNGKRYVKYKGKTYLSSNFIDEFKDLLELRIIDFDHLSEREQRDRGIIGPDEEYRTKKDNVSSMQNEYTMRKESEICQAVCCKCHVRITISRQVTITQYYKEQLEKYNYIKELKEKGCCICGFFDATILKYLHFDHLNPDEKIDQISNMIRLSLYTMEDLIEECKKCRVICESCHRIHTSEQRKMGII